MTSESEPIRENNQTPNTSGKADIQAPQGNPDIPRTSSVPPSPPSKTHCEITCKTEKNFWDHVKTGAEIIGIVLLAVYTGYTIKMYCVNKKAAEAAKDGATAAQNAVRQAERTMHMDQRAWIHVGAIDNQFILGRQIEVPLKIGNTGKTPAKKVTGDLAIQLLKATDDPDFVYTKGHPHFHLPQILVVPNTDINMTMHVSRYIKGIDHPIPVIYDQRLKDGIESGNLVVVVHGSFTYDDVFGVSHWFKFCTFGSPNLSKPGPAKCDEYNDTDNNE
jgi:hypothetical protein